MSVQLDEPKTFKFPALQKRICFLLMLVGMIALGLGFSGVYGNPQRAWANFLLNGIYFVTVAVFGLFFVALHYLTGAKWSEVIRKIPEAVSQYIPVGAGLMLVGLFGVDHLYEWTHGTHEVPGHGGHGDYGKSVFLSTVFFAIRMAVVLGLWVWFAKVFKNISRQKDEGVAVKTTMRWSAIFMIVFALSFALASFDWIMSLEPHWFSTVFAVYHFSGVFVAGMAVIAIMVIVLSDLNILKAVNENHIHDLGKYLFAFTLFWAYIWFCQFMLIWYGNIPEETVYFAQRIKGDWAWLFYFNLFINFIVPFGVLLSRAAKRNSALVFRVAILLLIGHWLDLYLMIMPPVTGAASNIGLTEVAVAFGFAGVFALTVGTALEKSPILPAASLLLTESQHHHQ